MHDSRCHLQMLASHVLDRVTSYCKRESWKLVGDASVENNPSFHLLAVRLQFMNRHDTHNEIYEEENEALRPGRVQLTMLLRKLQLSSLLPEADKHDWLPDTGIAELRRLAPMRLIDFNSQWWEKANPLCTASVRKLPPFNLWNMNSNFNIRNPQSFDLGNIKGLLDCIWGEATR